MHDASAKDINTGQLIFTVIGIASGNDLKAPAELTMLAKTLLHLDGITRNSIPITTRRRSSATTRSNSSPRSCGRSSIRAISIRHCSTSISWHSICRAARAEIVDLTAAGKLTIGIKLTQAEEFLSGIHKIANRITIGVVIAALLISSSLMMRVYPNLATIGYVLASIAAFYLIVSTFIGDRKDKEKAGFKGK